MFRLLLDMLLLGELSFAQAGCPLMLHGEPFLLYARVQIVLSDLEGFRMCYDWGGGLLSQAVHILCQRMEKELAPGPWRSRHYVHGCCSVQTAGPGADDRLNGRGGSVKR